MVREYLRILWGVAKGHSVDAWAALHHVRVDQLRSKAGQDAGEVSLNVGGKITLFYFIPD